jgi:hypothetical protein
MSQRLNTHDYPMLIKRLDQLSVVINMRNDSREYNELLQVLKEIDNRLVNYTASSGAENGVSANEDTEMRDEFDIETINVESVKAFRQYGGLTIFKRILLLSVLVVNTNNITTEPANLTAAVAKTESTTSMLSSSRGGSKSLGGRNSDDEDEEEMEQMWKPWRAQHNARTTITTTPQGHASNFSTMEMWQQTLINTFEKQHMLRIKCKCIQILNRIICLVSVLNSILKFPKNIHRGNRTVLG